MGSVAASVQNYSPLLAEAPRPYRCLSYPIGDDQAPALGRMLLTSVRPTRAVVLLPCTACVGWREFGGCTAGRRDVSDSIRFFHHKRWCDVHRRYPSGSPSAAPLDRSMLTDLIHAPVRVRGHPLSSLRPIPTAYPLRRNSADGLASLLWGQVVCRLLPCDFGRGWARRDFLSDQRNKKRDRDAIVRRLCQ